MPRPRPAYAAGHCYHFYNRGAARAPIFRDVDNYAFVVGKLRLYSGMLGLTVLAHCLMPNHYHILVRQNGEQRAGLLPQRVFNSYAKAYNKRYDRSGTLFEGPYRLVPAEDEAHLLQLCMYIHANRVAHGLLEHLEQWTHSDDHEWVHCGKHLLLGEVLSSSALYREFVEDYLVSRREQEDLARAVVEGPEE